MRRWSTIATGIFEAISRVVGLLGVIHELATGLERPIIVGVCALMMGLPDAWEIDRARRGARDDPPPPRPPSGEDGPGPSSSPPAASG